PSDMKYTHRNGGAGLDHGSGCGERAVRTCSRSRMCLIGRSFSAFANRRTKMFETMRRRTFLQGGIAAILGSACSRHHVRPDQSQQYLQTAVGAGKWIRSCTVRTEHGLAWPATPGVSQKISTDLYSGTSGVVLFLVELYRATGDGAWLTDARGGGDHIIGALPDKLSPSQAGLYAGVAGVGFVLHQLYLATGEQKYGHGAMRTVDLLHHHAQSAGSGVEWNSYTDVVFGGAGIG